MANTEQPFTDAALARYLSGECSPEEQLAIRRWLDANLAAREQLDRVRVAWEAAGKRGAPAFDIASMRRRLSSRISGPHRAHRAFDSRRSWLIPSAVAAVIIVAAGVTLTVSQGRRPEAPAAEWREVATTRSQRADVYLSDGTHVLLAPESRLRFTSPLSDTARDVRLEGRALFEVRHDSLRPFRVHTAGGVAEDLGTRFDVRQYAGDTVLQVVVAEGLVALSAVESAARAGAPASQPVRLSAGDVGTVTTSGRLTVERSADVAREIGWASGRLSFDAVPLRDAVRELRRYYNLEFAISDSATGSRRLTASFATESPAEVARIIGLSLELRHTIRGKTVTFAPRSAVR